MYMILDCILLQSIIKSLAQKNGSRIREGFSCIFQKKFLHYRTSVRYNRFALTEKAPELRQSLR